MEDYKKPTIEFYDAKAAELSEKYKQLMEMHRREEFPYFLSLLRGKSILDLGCGSGDHAMYFREQGCAVVGIDISHKMVELARSKGIDACMMDLEGITFEDKSFDGIWAVTSLPHVPKANMVRVAEKLSSLLKPEGILYVCVKEGTGEGFIPDEQNPSLRRYFAFYEDEELLQLFAQHFDCVPFHNVRTKVNETTFLQRFFRKKTQNP